MKRAPVKGFDRGSDALWLGVLNMIDTVRETPINVDRIDDLDGEKKTRWIRISVEMLEHSAFAGEPYSRRDAWLWLIANAAWKPKRIKHKGKMIVLERGQVLIGRAFLAETWGWSEQSVRTFVKFLVSETMLEINQSSGHFANVANICNYDKYQTSQPERGQQSNQSATRAQPEPNQTLTSNTNTTNTLVASSLPEPARDDGTPSCADLKILADRLYDAAKACLDNPANCQGLINTMIPQTWINSGCDLELDILPALRAKAATHKGKRVWSWDYFTDCVATAKAKRLAASKRIATAAAPADSKPALSRVPTSAPRLMHLNDESWKERIANEMIEQGLASVIN